ncbi:MAG TPA: hypothetical protein HPQ00_10150 [Magnetococcales bacterium]|nr:hypothetical protein [Magnetococcales bacterium]
MFAFSILIVILTTAMIFIPILGGYLTLIPGGLTLFLPGRLRTMALIACGINIINVLFMSPILRTNATIGLQHQDYKWAAIFLGIALFHGMVAIVVHFKHVRGKNKSTQTVTPTATQPQPVPSAVVTKPAPQSTPATPVAPKSKPEASTTSLSHAKKITETKPAAPSSGKSATKPPAKPQSATTKTTAPANTKPRVAKQVKTKPS